MRGVLGELTPRAMGLLAQLEPRGRWGRRARICRALHELGDEASPGSSPALAVRVHDPDRRIRDAAAWAFGRVVSARPAACALALEASDDEYGGRGAARPEFGAASEVGGLMALTLGSNGYLREAALRRLAELGRPEPLAFVLVRSNDWVPQVRRAALAAARAVLSPRFARAWVFAWPVIEHLERCGRVDRSDLDELVEDARRMLAAAWNGGAVEEGMRAADPLVRRAAWRLALEFAPADTSGELLLDALAAGDVVVARRAAVLAGRVADPEMRAELLARRLAHPDPTVRRQALHDHPVEGLDRALEPRLLDRHGGVRTAAAYLWRKRLDRDPAAFYRDRLTATDPRVVERALRGLAAEGSASDAVRAAPWLEAAAPRLRAAAFDLAARAEDPLPILRRALVDPSRHVRDVARRGLRHDRDRLDADLLLPALDPALPPGPAGLALALADRAGRWEGLGVALSALDHPEERVAARARRCAGRALQFPGGGVSSPSAAQRARLEALLSTLAPGPLLDAARAQLARTDP